MNNKNYKWVVVGLLWFVCFFNYADRQAIFSVFTPIQKEMGLSDVQLGWVGSAFMYVYALAGPLAGIIGDRFSRKFLIIGGLVFWSVVTVGMVLATKPGWRPFLQRKFKMTMMAIAGVSSTTYSQVALMAGIIEGGILADLRAEWVK